MAAAVAIDVRTDNDLQVFTTERKVALATAADAKRRRAFGDALRIVLVHTSAALPVHTIISSPRRTAVGKGRAADCHAGANVKWASAPHAAVET